MLFAQNAERLIIGRAGSITGTASMCICTKTAEAGNDVGRIEKEYDIPLEEDLRKNFSRIRRQTGYGSFYKLLLTGV